MKIEKVDISLVNKNEINPRFIKYDNYKKLVKKSGFITGHDYHPVWQGVVDAIHEAIGEPEMIFQDTSWVKKII
jgi:hypothetical protein